MKKKLQIFVSSTYTDLLEERQASVQTILRAGHIPAGMELFSAGNKSQLEIIKKWISESDIYTLILGGRYGTIESETQLSYTEIEYNYAVSINKPFFAIVLDDEYIDRKVRAIGKSVVEQENHDKYQEFRKLVLSKVCRICKDESEIKISILESIIDIQDDKDLIGWIRGDEVPDNSLALNEIALLRADRDELKKNLETIVIATDSNSNSKLVGGFKYEDIIKVLLNNQITFPSSFSTSDDKKSISALELFVTSTGVLTKGVSVFNNSRTDDFYINSLVPLLLNFGLVERISNSKGFEKFVISDNGRLFLAYDQLEKI